MQGKRKSQKNDYLNQETRRYPTIPTSTVKKKTNQETTVYPQFQQVLWEKPKSRNKKYPKSKLRKGNINNNEVKNTSKNTWEFSNFPTQGNEIWIPTEIEDPKI